MLRLFNPNPYGRNVTDCSVRSICAAFGINWERAFDILAEKSKEMYGMPEDDDVWGAVFRDHGFAERRLPAHLAYKYTADDFAEDHPRGVYILALPKHVVCVKNGCIWDSWDSRNERVLYYFERVYS